MSHATAGVVSAVAYPTGKARGMRVVARVAGAVALGGAVVTVVLASLVVVLAAGGRLAESPWTRK